MKFIIPLLSFITLFVVAAGVVHGQAVNIGIANTYSVDDTNLEDGDVITILTEEGTLRRARGSANEEVFGVYVESPSVVYITDVTLSPIVREGDVIVNATTMGGPIRIGDFVTTSPIPGKAQKASGTSTKIVGMALDPLPENGGVAFTYEGKTLRRDTVRVALNVVGAPGSDQSVVSGEDSARETQDSAAAELERLRDAPLLEKGLIIARFLINTITKEGDPSFRMLRYLIGALVAVVTTYFSFTFFGKNVTKGIESIGRNPLAKVQIQTMIVLNIILISIVTLGGVILSLIIIK